jgi:hypothetical protein
MRTIDVTERRARLARRHRLTGQAPATDVVEATRSLVCLHATDPATVYLSAWARVPGMSVADLDRALYHDRSLVKHLAMRRTLFVFPREQLGDVQAASSNTVAAKQHARLIADVERAGLHRDGARWFARASAQVMTALADGRQATSSELRAEIPELEGSISFGEGKSWGGSAPVAPRVLTVLSAAGQVVRATNDGSWAVSRPRWASTESWLGAPIEPRPEAAAIAVLVRSWLRSFGPGTAADIKWWLGSTLTAVRRALVEVGAVEVDLDGRIGYVLPDDVEPERPVEPWVALLPPLDPTTMGWYDRDWYLDPHRPHLFDTSGNAGPTVWCEGRTVGGWRQRESGEVELQMLDDVGAERLAMIEREAARLTDWLGGRRVLPRFPSPLSKALGDAAG